MAVYTELTDGQISELLGAYGLGDLQSFHGAGDGIENTTYFLSLRSGVELVLTLFETFSREVLPFYIELTSALHDKGLPVPCPIRDDSGSAIQILAEKPALLFPFITGKHCYQPSLEEIRKVARVLGKIHQQSLRLSLRQPNPKDLEWMEQTWRFVKPSLSKEENQLIEDQLQLRKKYQALDLPRAVIHGDLFRDNVLFHDGEISAVIDFYNAGTDSLILDVAIAVIDWCIDSEGLVDAAKRSEFLLTYENQRSFSSLEHEHWQIVQQLAATLFWLSRQKTQLLAQRGSQQAVKDPESCKKLLLQNLGRL